MDSVPAIEQFMLRCFRERTAAKKQLMEVHRFYWERYLHPDCLWDIRRGVIERSEAEKIISITPSEFSAEVVTTGTGICRSRYHVKAAGEGWVVQGVDSEAPDKGWVRWGEQASALWPKRREQISNRTTGPVSEAEEIRHQVRDPAIEGFMTGYFRERTETWKRELEIFGDYGRRFYSTECDWTRLVPSFKSSEAERIVNIERVESGAHVITDGFAEYRMRYQLNPAGQSWVIREVDMECPFCLVNGRNENCIWCNGTIWEHRNIRKNRAERKSPGEDVPPDLPRRP